MTDKSRLNAILFFYLCCPFAENLCAGKSSNLGLTVKKVQGNYMEFCDDPSISQYSLTLCSTPPLLCKGLEDPPILSKENPIFSNSQSARKSGADASAFAFLLPKYVHFKL